MLRRVAKRVAFVADDATKVESGVVVLAYHRVGARTPSPVDLPADMFRRQMEHLAASTVLGLEEALDVLAGNLSAPPADKSLVDPSPVTLTFDDGTADFVEVALPVLVELGLPAVLYVTTENVDTAHPFPNEGTPISWNGLRECLSTGVVTIGAHTHTHALLDRCDPLTVDLELDVCNNRIADELGIKPRHFAYPKARAGNRYADGAVRLRYLSAAVAGTRPNIIGASDPWRLRRSPIQNADGWEGFARKAAGGMRAEDDVRRVVDTVRHRGRST